MSEKDEKVDYSSTLNLPKTDFPMRGNLPQNEPKILEDVIDNGLYEKMLKKNEGKTPFVLHDGPPYANGEIHIGHALNKILKDTVVRYKNLQGYWTPFIPGFDTHGMPTEKKAIEKLGLDRSKIPVNTFRDTCKKFTEDYKDIQIEGFKRLGVLADWDNPYITYQPQMEAKQVGVFADMYKKGYIYKGLKPVYWCTDCETALAEAEIEYKDITLKQSVLISISQALAAAFPGVSRSGITMTVGRKLGIDRESVAKYSFLLSTPIVFAATLYKFKDFVFSIPFFIGILASFLVGIVVIKFLLQYLKKGSFKVFAIYRVIIGIIVIGLFISRL